MAHASTEPDKSGKLPFSHNLGPIKKKKYVGIHPFDPQYIF